MLMAALAVYVIGGTLLAFALGRFMHGTGERAEAALRLKQTPTAHTVRRRSA
jgi:hypothetical protein